MPAHCMDPVPGISCQAFLRNGLKLAVGSGLSSFAGKKKHRLRNSGTLTALVGKHQTRRCIAEAEAQLRAHPRKSKVTELRCRPANCKSRCPRNPKEVMPCVLLTHPSSTMWRGNPSNHCKSNSIHFCSQYVLWLACCLLSAEHSVTSEKMSTVSGFRNLELEFWKSAIIRKG